MMLYCMRLIDQSFSGIKSNFTFILSRFRSFKYHVIQYSTLGYIYMFYYPCSIIYGGKMLLFSLVMLLACGRDLTCYMHLIMLHTNQGENSSQSPRQGGQRVEW